MLKERGFKSNIKQKEPNMTYLIAIFCPPLYFLIKKQWVGFCVSTLLLVLCFFMAFTFILIPVVLIIWALCSICAVWNLRRLCMHEHAEVLATKMAEKMNQSQSVPPLMPKK